MILNIVFFLFSTILYLMPYDLDGYKNLYPLTVLILIFHIIQLVGVYKKERTYFFINPIFIGVFFTFLLQLGCLSNLLLYAIDGTNQIRNYSSPLEDEKQWMSKAMYLISLASLFCWIGYRANIGDRIFSLLKRLPIYAKIFTTELSQNRVMYIAIFAYFFKAYLYSIGLFGRVLSEKYFVPGEGYSGIYFIREFGNITYIIFILLCINKFKKNTKKNKILFYSSFVLELFFGFIYGARSTFVYPILLIFLVNYYVREKINKLILFILLPLALFMSVTFVLDYKNYVLTNDFVRSKSIFEIYKDYKQYANGTTTDGVVILTAIRTLVDNTCFVQDAAIVIRYVDLGKRTQEIRERVISSFLVVPFEAFIPQFIIGGNKFLWGLWHKNEVANYQLGLNYSLAMSPVGFLYLGGGYFLVILFFFIYGVLLRIASNFLKQKNRFLFLIYVVIMMGVYNYDTVVSAVMINYVRAIIIFPIIIFFLFGKIRVVNN